MSSRPQKSNQGLSFRVPEWYVALSPSSVLFLTSRLGDESGFGGGSWADEVSDLPTDVNYERSASKQASRPAGTTSYNETPKYDRPLIPLPDHPPFTARFMNLDYRTTEESFTSLFATGFKVVEIKMPLDIETNKSRGFAFVEFEDRDSLEKATHMDGTNFDGRNLRVLVAEQRAQRGGFNNRRDVPDDGKDRDFDNWERRGPLPPLEGQQQRNFDGGFRSNRPVDDRNYEGGFRSSGRPPISEERDFDGGFRSSRPPQPEDGRDYDNWEHRGPPPAHANESKFRSPRFHDKEEREPEKADLVDNWRSVESKSKSPEPVATKPAGRPKLNLAPRSKPLESSSNANRSSSLFGSAKPVDTAKKLQEIEERQARIHQERVEREEKRAAKLKEQQEAKSKVEAARKSFSALTTEEDAPEQVEEVAPRRKEELTTAEKLLLAEAKPEELEGDDWNVVVNTKRGGRR